MTAPLLMTCGLTDKRLPGFVLLRESSGTDGSFFVSSILGQQLKASPQSKIVLVAAHHGLGHYHSVGLRLGYSLTQVCDRGRVRCVDVMKMIASGGREANLDDEFVSGLHKRILEEVLAVPEGEDCCLIIDDVSVLRAMTDNDDLVLRFCEQMRRLGERRKEGHLSVILKLNTYDAYPVMANNLHSRSAFTITLDSLKSGRFKEVDGRITISRENAGEDKVVLYKVNDRTVKTFAKGFM